MNFVRIFEDADCRLFSVKKVGASQSALLKLFEFWDDSFKVWKYLEKRDHALKKWYKIDEITEGVLDTISVELTKESKRLLQSINSIPVTYKNNPNSLKLDKMFEKFHDSDDEDTELRESRAYGLAQHTHLRIFAIRIEPNCYLVTGGMIKVTGPTSETKPEGPQEIRFMKDTRTFLKSKNINNRNALIKYIDGKQ